jgi:hypothetical protein
MLLIVKERGNIHEAALFFGWGDKYSSSEEADP